MPPSPASPPFLSGPWQLDPHWVSLPHAGRVLYVVKGAEIIAQCWETGFDRGLSPTERERETRATATLITAAPLQHEALSLAADFLHAYRHPHLRTLPFTIHELDIKIRTALQVAQGLPPRSD